MHLRIRRPGSSFHSPAPRAVVEVPRAPDRPHTLYVLSIVALLTTAARSATTSESSLALATVAIAAVLGLVLATTTRRRQHVLVRIETRRAQH